MSAPDRPGPHPENQRKRRELRGPRTTLVGVLALVAAGALARLCGLGSGPVATTDVTGLTPLLASNALAVMLLVLVAITQAMAAGLLAVHQRHARTIAWAAALLVLAWAVAQIVVLDQVTWFPLGLLAAGALEALLIAGCTPRDAAKKPRTARQRDLRAKP